jgi:hypothetical protein
MRKTAWIAGVSAAAAIVGWLSTRPRSLTKGAGTYLHRTLNHAKGLAYRVTRRHPSTDVDDSVLVDRIRSTIGPLEKQLHVSRVNVTVENGIAILHGDIESPAAAKEIERGVRSVAGVRGVRSNLSP